jgi:hypothetical protein
MPKGTFTNDVIRIHFLIDDLFPASLGFLGVYLARRLDMVNYYEGQF